MRVPAFQSSVAVSRRQLTRFAVCGLTFSALLTGCGGGNDPSTESSANSNSATAAASAKAAVRGTAQPTPSGTISSATVNVSSTVSGVMPSANFLGLSYEKNKISGGMFRGSATNMIALTKRLGYGVLRLGGAAVEMTTWQSGGAGGVKNVVSQVDIDNLAAFVKASGWKVIYGLPLAKAQTADVVAEAAYAQKALGSSLIGFELGNEPDGYNTSYFPSTWGFSNFMALWSAERGEIAAAVPAAKFVGPATAPISRATIWTIPMAKAVGSSKLALMTQHYYRTKGDSSTTMATMLSDFSPLDSGLNDLQAAAKATGIPFRIDETNSFYGVSTDGVWDQFGSAIWAVDFMMMVAQHSGTGVNFHGGGMGPGYTPIADTGWDPAKLYPLYYALTAVADAGTGNMLTSTINANGRNVSSYAIKTASGINVVMVNKEAATSEKVTITLPQNVSSATATQLIGPSLSSYSGETYSGGTINLDGTVSSSVPPYMVSASGKTVTAYVPAGSAVIVKAQ